VPRTQWAALAQRYRSRWLLSEQPVARTEAEHIAVTQLDAAARIALPSSPPRADAAGKPFLHVFSSGTTGEPKAALFTQRQISDRLEDFVREIGWRAGDRLMGGRPWPEKVGLHFVLLAHAAGAALVNFPLPATRPELALAMRKLGVTGIAASPTAMRKLLASAMPRGETLPALRVLCFGGAPSSPEEIARLRAEITPNVFHLYASTEAGLIALLRPQERADGGVGRVVQGIEVRAEGEDGAPLAAGQVGRLACRAPWIPREYPYNPQASAARFRDGWFYPGDLASIDAAGWVTLHGRDDEVINFSGVKILPREIEPALLRHPNIAEAVLLGIADAKTGQLPVAFVVPRGKLDLEALRPWVNKQVGKLRTPARFVTVRELPRNPAGKVRREPLVALFHRLRATRPPRS